MKTITESQRQDLALRLVEREIFYCVSSLISTLSTLVQEAGSKVDLSWEDDILPLMERVDYEEAGRAVLYNCDDLFDLETMCDNVADWSDACTHVGYDRSIEYADKDGEMDTIDFDTWFEDYCSDDEKTSALDGIRTYITDHVLDWREFCSDNDVEADDYGSEVYEHWLVSNWLSQKLSERGEVTGEVCGLTIWGRCTTGQSICLDHVIQEIALELWGDELLTSKEEV